MIMYVRQYATRYIIARDYGNHIIIRMSSEAKGGWALPEECHVIQLLGE